MRNMGKAALAAVMFGAAFGVNAADGYADALVWRTTGDEGRKLFPEQLPGAPAPQGWDTKPSFGVAFSGGGVRAAAATLGQLRALVELGWYGRLRYVSSISGGTWASLPFTYLPGEIKDDEYLGPLVAPADLRAEHFFDSPRPRSLARAMTKARVVHDLFEGWITGQGDESYAEAISGTFLKPFGLADETRGFAWSAEQARQIAERNAGCHDVAEGDDRAAFPRHKCGPGEQPSARITSADFYLPGAGRPFHIANASLLAERGHGRVVLPADSKFPLEVTPYYTGVGVSQLYQFKAVQSQMWVGGALIESFAFDTWPPLRVSADERSRADVYRVAWRRQGNRFTLRDAIAVSSAAPQQPTSGLGWRNLGLPEFQQWGMSPLTGIVERPLLHEHAFGDGGHVDNIGLGALLERGVRHVIVFANMPFSFRPKPWKIGPITYTWPDLVDSINAYFDPPLTPQEKHRVEQELRRGKRKTREPVLDGANYLITGIVPSRAPACPSPTERAACALQELRSAFVVQQDAGQPLVHCQEYTINTANARYRIPKDLDSAHICWVYLDRKGSQGWVDALSPQLPLQLRSDIERHENAFKRFPNYWTAFEGLQDAAHLDVAQITALSQLTSWTVCASAARIAREFAELKLPQQGCPGIPAAPIGQADWAAKMPTGPASKTLTVSPR